MNILYIGDIMGEPGVRLVADLLPKIKKEEKIDLVIAQAENVTNGKGISKQDFQQLRSIGIDFCTGGNWTLFDDDIHKILSDDNEPIIRPANYPPGTDGKGYKYIDTKFGPVLVISLLGQIVGRDANKEVDNPLLVVDEILREAKKRKPFTTIVNFHGDFSSEKRVIGYYLDGRVGAVVGDHWHVPTADAMVLPRGTAHITDVGMCGTLDSSLGIKLDIVIHRWLDQRPSRNILETDGRKQFNSVIISINDKTGLAENIFSRQIITEK